MAAARVITAAKGERRWRGRPDESSLDIFGYLDICASWQEDGAGTGWECEVKDKRK